MDPIDEEKGRKRQSLGLRLVTTKLIETQAYEQTLRSSLSPEPSS